ncbi:alpha/beta fold hydrolase [Nocardia sp. CDC159]|uniref:Alpha/beta fold hydrolase n=1 Tax=Nocardia pulmonis TaxID=2951408 RepID=A0A9X2E8X3_9NOCA|nr:MULTISPECIES: alpha/beta fold hydrolase [Nocardia]MCM6775790.1 alpha/beta fold hydrolase [Nocardia pulmonis]MCM6788234.1 alpha/beta fold hydrolase [Nocardia sp. CDC159]
MPFFEGARGRLHYRIWPVAEPVAVVALFPGTGQHSAHYHRFARALGARSIETWALDVPGQGLSEGDPAAPGTPAELAPDARGLAELLRAERAGTPLFVVGHSLGAATALAAGIDCAGLVLTGTPTRAAASCPELPARPPVLALHGVDDRRCPIDAIRQWTARQRSVGLREYADAGHDLLHEPVHARVTADIAEWIDGVRAEWRGVEVNRA